VGEGGTQYDLRLGLDTGPAKPAVDGLNASLVQTGQTADVVQRKLDTVSTSASRLGTVSSQSSAGVASVARASDTLVGSVARVEGTVASASGAVGGLAASVAAADRGMIAGAASANVLSFATKGIAASTAAAGVGLASMVPTLAALEASTIALGPLVPQVLGPLSTGIRGVITDVSASSLALGMATTELGVHRAATLENAVASGSLASSLEKEILSLKGAKLSVVENVTAQRQLRDAKRVYDDALRAGLINQQRHNELLGLARQRYEDLNAPVKSAAFSLGNLKGMFAGLVAILALIGFARIVGELKQLATESVQAAITIQRAESTLRAATGTQEKATESISFLREESERLGLVFRDQIDVYGRLAAASRGTALEGKAVREVYLGIAEAGTVYKLSAEQMGGALNAVQQMISKGTVQAEELRGQLGERLPGAFQIAARAMNVTTAQLGKMLEQGQVIAADFLPKFAAQLRKELGAEVPAASQNAQAAFNRLENVIFEIKAAIGEALLPVLAEGSKLLLELVKIVRESGVDFSGLAQILGAYADALKLDREALELLNLALADNDTKLAAVNVATGGWATAIKGLGDLLGWWRDKVKDLSYYIGILRIEMQDAAEQKKKLDAAGGQVGASVPGGHVGASTDKPPGTQKPEDPFAAEEAEWIKQQQEMRKVLGEIEVRAAAAASSASALYRAHKEGYPAIVAANRAQAVQEAMLPFIIKDQWEAARAAGAAAGAAFDLQRKTDLLVASQEAAADIATAVAAAAARAEDAINGGTLASEKAARKADVEAFAKSNLLDVEGRLATQYAADLELRDAKIRASDQEAEAARRDLDFSQSQLVLEAELADVLAGNLEASRAAAAQVEIENRLREAGLAGLQNYTLAQVAEIARINEEVRSRRKAVDLTKDQTDALRRLASLTREADFSTRVASISIDNDRLRSIEEDYLAFLRDLGQGSVEEGERVQREILEQFGFTAEFIKGKLGEIADASRIRDLRQAGKGPGAAYREEREEILRIAKLYGDKDAAIARGAQTRLFEMSADFWQNQLGLWQSALGFLGQYFGNTFQELADLAGNLVQAVQFGRQVQQMAASSSNSNIAGAAAAIGGIATVFAIFAVIYDGVEKHIKKMKLLKYGNSTEFTMTGGQIGSTVLEQRGFEVFNAIKDAVRAFGDALGGAVTDITKIGIRIRNDGKYVAAYVNGVMIGHFNDVNDAIRAALVEAVRTDSIKLKGISDLVRQGMKSWTFPDFDSMMEFLGQLREISDMGKSSGEMALTQTLRHLDELWAALMQLSAATPAVIEGMENLGRAEVQAFQGWRNQITGHQETPEEARARMEQEAVIFNAQKALRIAEWRLELLDLQQEQERLRGRIVLVRAGGEISEGDLDIHAGYLRAKADLVEKEGGIYMVQLSMIEAQIQAIETIIAALEAIPDIDLGEIKLPRGAGGRGAGGQRNPLQEMIDEANRAYQAANMGQYAQSVLEINRKWDDGIAAAGDMDEALRKTEKQHRDAIKAAHGNAEAIRKANAAYEHQIENIERTRHEIDLANAARQRELDLVARQIREDAAQFLSPASGGTFGLSQWEQQGAGIESMMADLIEGNEALIAAGHAAALSEVELAEIRHNAYVQLGKDIVASLGLPLEQTRARVRAMRDAMKSLADVVDKGGMSIDDFNRIVAETADQANVEFLTLAESILETMGATEKSEELKRQLAEANFLMQVAQLNILYQGLTALGEAGTALQLKLKPILDYINDPTHWPDFNAPPVETTGSGNGGGSNDPFADIESLIEAMVQQGREWTGAVLGPMTRSAQEMKDRLSDLQAQAAELANYDLQGHLADALAALQAAYDVAVQHFVGELIDSFEVVPEAVQDARDLRARIDDAVAALVVLGATAQQFADLSAATQAAIGHFVDDSLEEFERLGRNPLRNELDDINAHFDDLRVAFETLGVSADQMARLEQARILALEDFWRRATEDIRALIDEMRANDPRVSSQSRFLTAQERFRDLQARAAAGDLDALQQLRAAADEYRAATQGFLGSGVGSQRIFDEILHGLETVANAGVSEDNPVAVRLGETNDILVDIRSILAGEGGVLYVADDGARGAWSRLPESTARPQPRGPFYSPPQYTSGVVTPASGPGSGGEPGQGAEMMALVKRLEERDRRRDETQQRREARTHAEKSQDDRAREELLSTLAALQETLAALQRTMARQPPAGQ
jgi:tape measure domain-containing protein